ncbi:WD40 repeat-like protein [Saitoella complicata NRRL Y-17804]|uniref:Uncharacterized protein n=1 Tax=Saitoella complicata (strain BCRC 22490 / CBS 7301 / JCM 7358 / NBRC 10748 / NRRL Y-17804) TaxID=698492 RepID=A0A0E9NB19_SAICN|nr:WD40 repeat-like protein [Saitoella complicata NRRL Y-17804]ODQ53804.1 WD40 repeat-like protein [Saitoella complicata NRRL Y-17804]GAO46998.1 hypothetical protein G7K_1212-t1 [Saitoella complicata NRRL Y-17804]
MPMVSSTRRKISYVIPLPGARPGHLLPVNALAVDTFSAVVLYSAGRDGKLIQWDLGLDQEEQDGGEDEEYVSVHRPREPMASMTKYRAQVDAHTHWVNDIALVSQNTAVVSASSDTLVKIWRPEENRVDTLGHHTDYVKCLASAGPSCDWIASGGLDRRVMLWDLNGYGEKTRIDLDAAGGGPKGSVYALGAGGGVIASGGPERVVRLWDPNSGKRIAKLVGHTDNVRSVLVSHDGRTILTASSDSTCRIWDVGSGRCQNTLTMHSDSVWKLYSEHPDLKLFYSADKSGYVARTDVRNVADPEYGTCVAICQEGAGVNGLVCANDYIWTATADSSDIRRWEDYDLSSERERDYLSVNENGNGHTPSRTPTSPSVPRSALLPLTSTGHFAFATTGSRDPEVSTMYSAASVVSIPQYMNHQDDPSILPIRSTPTETIHGQHGLIKHHLLNNRRHVLTLDTSSELALFDIVKCQLVKQLGKGNLEEMVAKLQTTDSIVSWCSVDTRVGNMCVTLDERTCFDAEIYADEVEGVDGIEFREDQRINLGKWALVNLFKGLINTELARHEDFMNGLRAKQQELEERKQSSKRANAPSFIPIEQNPMANWETQGSEVQTPRPLRIAIPTPGMKIGLATPAPTYAGSPQRKSMLLPDSTTGKSGAGYSVGTPSLPASLPPATTRARPSSSSGATALKSPGSPMTKMDYFSSAHYSSSAPGSPAVTPGGTRTSTPEATTATTPGGSRLLRMFGGKKREGSVSEGKGEKNGKGLGPTSAPSASVSQTPVPEPSTPSFPSETPIPSGAATPVEADGFEDVLLGVVRRIRRQVEQSLLRDEGQIQNVMSISLPSETPPFLPPSDTMIVIKEERPDMGAPVDLFHGTVATVGDTAHVDMLEQVAPAWLGDVLLLNKIPLKDIVKIPFVLHPSDDSALSELPTGNARLNANRMLRVRKILAYVAERIDNNERPPTAIDKPVEDWLELLCNGEVLPITMTLASVRTAVFKQGGDVQFQYRLRRSS